MSYIPRKSAALVFASAYLSTALAQKATHDQRSVAVAASDSPFPSALLVAERTENGVGVSLYPTGLPTPDETPRYFPLGNPTAIAEAGGDLYAWDEATDALVAVDLNSGEQRVLWRGAPFDHPTQISVSVDRVIAVFDPEAKGIYWLTTDPSRKFSFGDDTGNYSRDGQCNDRRFQGEGMAPAEKLDGDGFHRDAYDCSQLVLKGKITLLGGQRVFGTLRSSDFGDNEGRLAKNGRCEDPRFATANFYEGLTKGGASSTGSPTAAATSVGHDADDCRRAFELGEASFRLNADRPSRSGEFGDDFGPTVYNGVCDDPRFTGPGAAPAANVRSLGHDATDCARSFNSGAVDFAGRTAPRELAAQANQRYDKVDFGNDYAGLIDGECDDPRFVGQGMAVTLSPVNVGGDRTDCQALYRDGLVQLLDRLDQTVETVDARDVDFGDDSSSWSGDGECDDPRFYGEGVSATLLKESRGHDATDCRELYEKRRIRLRATDLVRLAANPGSEVTGIGKLAGVPGQPVGVTFASRDSLAVLDRKTSTIFTYGFRREYDYLTFGGDATARPVSAGKSGDLRTIAARDGLLYVADNENVYAYVAAERRWVPALAERKEFDDIRQLAAGPKGVFVLSDKPLDVVQRTLPVEVVLEGTLEADQASLVDLYVYLSDNALLEWRPARSESSYPTLEHFLVAQKAWLAPLEAGNPKRPLGDVRALATEFCARNEAFCGSNRTSEVFGRAVRPGVELQVPKIELKSYMQVQTVDLKGGSIEDYFRRRVSSPELRTEFYASIGRINKSLASTPPAALPQMKPREPVTLPYEAWSLTVTVRRDDYDAKSSPLWRWAGRPGIGVYSREAFNEKSALTPDGQPQPQPQPPPQPQPQPDAAAAESERLCGELKLDHERWAKDLGYPATYAPLATATPPIGILEKAGQLLKQHQAFSLVDDIAWYTPGTRIGELAPAAVPQSGGPPSQTVMSIARYQNSTDHGTHVSSLIGARKGPCWSGLLPRSRLVHIDVTDQALTRSQVSKARASNTKVFNVSQQLAVDNDQDENVTFLDNLRAWMLSEFNDVLFVAAAGNRARDLNLPFGAPYPAGFGDSANVVTVTALGAAHDVLGTHDTDGVTQTGVNFGKRVVDLAAQGTKILGATAEHMFGSATGTSEAAPAVSAAAAYIIEATEVAPGDAKARLIAAARWYTDLFNDVWGGQFDFGDAVMFPLNDVLQTSTGGDDRTFVMEGAKPDSQILLDNTPWLYVRSGPPGTAAAALPFDAILSLRLNTDQTAYRVVYKDPATKSLMITLDAQISGRIECSKLKLVDAQTQALTDVPNGCTNLNVTQVTKFIRHLPYHVAW